ncbi:hypothetical protein [Leucobacter sp. 1207-22]
MVETVVRLLEQLLEQLLVFQEVLLARARGFYLVESQAASQEQ